MADGDLVDITLPSGEAATVPQANLAQALAAGASPVAAKGAYEEQLGGGLGQAASFAFGAGRTASFGLSDALLAEGANVIGGDAARKEMLRGLNVAKDVNPYATMGGEAAGLFVGAGEGIMAGGAAAEAGVASRLGGGLAGRIGSLAVRGAAEGGALGVQHQITEDTLGDHAYTGEKLWAAAGKEGLIGGAFGAGLGALAHAGASALGGLAHNPGPRPASMLDEIAGVEGAGVPLREEARTAETFIQDLQKSGATSEQAARMVDEASTIARARTAGGPASGFVDDMAERFAASRAGGNEEMREVLTKGYADRATRLANQDEILDAGARKLADKGTRVMRDMEDVLNEVHFSEKGSQMAKLTDPTKWEAARDTALKSLQDTDAVLSQLEMTASKGGQEGAVRNLRKQLTDFYATNAKIGEAAGSVFGQQENATRDFFMKLDGLKRSVDKFAGHGQSMFGRTEASHEFRALADRLRSTLEDESVWGAAGGAQREWNSTFSLAKGRRDDFGRRFAVSVDQVSGVPVPELDAGKLKSALRQLEGAEGDQAVKTTEAFIDGLRARTEAIEKHGTLTADQMLRLSNGKAALEDFATTFGDAKKEAAVISRLRTQQLEEQGRSLGGVVGLATDIMTKPLTTMERLGALKASTERLENGIARGIDKFFSGKSAAVRSEVTAALARPRDAIVKEIGDLRELAGNQPAMQARVGKMIGDLGTFAPKVAASTATTAMRALTYLAGEAPIGRSERSMVSTKTVTRYSDQEINVYENKRNAAFHPETVVNEMQLGKLNRDGIKAVKFVSPILFARMQDKARDQLFALEQKGLLDSMPYQKKAAISTLLEVPADGTWVPGFIAMMQASKAQVQQEAPASGPVAKGGGRRPIKMNTSLFETEAQQVEGRTT